MIRNTLLLISLIFLILLYWIRDGISMNSLKIGDFYLTGLYLKLDNKLILKIGQLHIPKAKKQKNIGDLDKSIRQVRRALTYFEYIELDSIEFTNTKYRIIYADNTIYIRSNEYEIAGMITPIKGGLKAKIPLVYIKKYDLSLNGEFLYDYDSEDMRFEGRYSIASIDGNISADMRDKRVKFALSSKSSDGIGALLDLLEVPEDTRTWIDRRVLAQHYRLVSLLGGGVWGDDGFELDMAALRAELELKDVEIYFHETLMPITAKSTTIHYRDGRLNFDLKEPYYLQKSMRGSKISLLHLTGDKNLQLLLKLNFNCRYDKEIDTLLKGYDISIPVQQKVGKSRVNIRLDIDLDSSKVKTEGRVFISKGIMEIGGVALPTRGGEVTFNSSRVALWGVDIHDDWYSGIVNGFINLDTDRAKLKIDLKKHKIGDKKGTSIVIKNRKKLSVLMNFKDRLKFDIPALKLKINERKGRGIDILSSDIKPLLRYVRGLPLELSGGHFSVHTKDYKRYKFDGKAKWKHSYIYGKSGYISSLPFSGTFKGKSVSLNALKNSFVYDSKNSLIRIKNINIDAKKMTELYSSKRGAGEISKLRVKGKRSVIRYGKYVLLTDRFDLGMRGKSLTFEGTKDGDTVKLKRVGNRLSVHANKIRDRMLRSLINFGGLHGGRYSLDFSGDTDGDMRGVIDIKGGAIDSFKAYNDLIALFNTIPALMALSDPGFSKKGFVIRDGRIEFDIRDDIVYINKIYLNGKSSTIVGRGTVHIKSGKLNIDLAIQTAREIGSILGSLPLVGYILFGKDKSVTTGVKIRGTMDKPNVKTNPVEEALLLPFELIKRTITSPAHIINN